MLYEYFRGTVFLGSLVQSQVFIVNFSWILCRLELQYTNTEHNRYVITNIQLCNAHSIQPHWVFM